MEYLGIVGNADTIKFTLLNDWQVTISYCNSNLCNLARVIISNEIDDPVLGPFSTTSLSVCSSKPGGADASCR